MQLNTLSMVHDFLKQHVRPGAFCIDATAGKGRDTALLCRLSGPSGHVLAFDIQQDAIDSTNALLEKEGLSHIAKVVLDSHANMDKYVTKESADCVVFNLGYLPHGDHSIYTQFDSTREAILKGLDALKSGGVMCVSIYYGGDSGYEEKDALIPWLKTLDDKRYQVLVTYFHNWKKEPPIPVFIFKN
jgi:methylase of polypeptide subunit release factors